MEILFAILITIAVIILAIGLGFHLTYKRMVSQYQEEDDDPELLARIQEEEEQESAKRQELLKTLVVYRTLRDSVHDGMTLDEMIDAFINMSKLPVGDPDDLLFESGTFHFTSEKLFYFSLVRQFQFLDEDEYVQLHLDVTYTPSIRTFGLRNVNWASRSNGDFFEMVRRSPAYHAVNELPIYQVQVYIEDT